MIVANARRNVDVTACVITVDCALGSTPGPISIGGIVIHHAAVLAHGTDHIGNAITHCEACGYQLHAIVQDWKAAYDLLQAGLVSVIVVAARDIWAPRIEYAERHQRTVTAAGSSNSRWRRARTVRRNR